MMALESLTWAFWIIRYRISEQGFNHNPLVTSIGFSMIWPNDLVLDPNMTHIQKCTRFHQGKNSEQVALVSDRKSGLWSIHKGYLRFDLVFDPTRPIFKLEPDFMKTNILTNFHDNRNKNVASRVYTRFFKKIWPSFWPKMTHFQTRPRFYQ